MLLGAGWAGRGRSVRLRLMVLAGIAAAPGCVPLDPAFDGPSNDNSSRNDDGPTDVDLPDVAYCDRVSGAPSDQVAFEDEVLELVNAERARGASCGDLGRFAPADPVVSNAALRCAARNHSRDMAERGFFDHTNPDGEGPGERIARTGYQPRTWGENIAFGQTSPRAVVDAWMESPGHCANVMNPAFTELGVGYEAGDYWTQVFGAPREP